VAPAGPRRRDRLRTLHLQLGQEVIYLLMSIFALVSLLLALYATQAARPTPPAVPDTRSKQISDLDKRNSQLLIDVEALKARERQLVDEIKKLNDKPPIISLEEQQGYKFESGDASLTPAFREKLTREKVPELIRYANTYSVNVIEVIGHTDEIPVGTRISNLDSLLIPFLQSGIAGPDPTQQLQATDNAGLGMARAAAVARYLLADPSLKALKMRILPLSGAQVIDVNDTLSSGSDQREDRNRRRIEIRARRAN
jgi:outer membrane protein OmpA-like peptidoglycan-associated protein